MVLNEKTMKHETTSFISLKDSIATQLLKTVFYFYFILTVVVTLTHMSVELLNTKKQVEQELKIAAHMFAPGLAQALWDINFDQLSPIFLGIVQFPSIVGVKVKNEQGDNIGQIGMILNNDGQVVEEKEDGIKVLITGYTGLFFYSFPINYEEEGAKIKVGEAVIYSSTKVVFNEVKLGFMMIIANAFIKTFFFWILFLWIARKKLSKPLAELTASVKRINLSELDKLKVSVKTEGNNELKVLEKAFNNMIQNLLKARFKLQELISSYRRFFPHEFLTHLNKNSITDLNLGDAIKENMCILFSDLRNFTAISEQMTPEESFSFLNSYFNQIAPIIKKHSGFIDKFIGDAMMALFASEPDKALQAAIDIFDRLKKYNNILENKGQSPVKMGIGIHFGSMILGTIGEEMRMDTTVISDAVNLASRLEGMTKIYDTPLIISESVYNNLKEPENFAIRMIDKVRAKGKKEAVIIFEVYDMDPPEILNKKADALKFFQKGLELYYLKKIKEAKELFEKSLSIYTEDKVSKIYIRRCTYYLEKGMDDDWDGIAKLDIK
jgi:class 3 adenylate cyclase